MMAIIAAPVAATARDDALDHIIKTGIVRVAVPDNFPPFGDLGPDAKLQGYDIATAALLADALGVISARSGRGVERRTAFGLPLHERQGRFGDL